MNIQDNINNYFKNKNILVSYNTLNSSEELIRAYVKDFNHYVDKNNDKWSHFVKSQIYNSIYDFEARPKSTGFEYFNVIDKKFRRKISPMITRSQFSTTSVLSRNENTKIDISYKETLKNSLKKFVNPLLYYSGGIDSELVALAMMDTGVKFTPVIFNLTDNKGFSRNIDDITYAYRFCNKHGLYPIIKTINIEELWQSREFEEFAIDLQIISPQIVTHAWMVKEMMLQYSDRPHVFGGEVRFHSGLNIDNDISSNLILLNKEPGLGLGGAYIDDYAGLNPAPPTGVGLEIGGKGLWYWLIQEEYSAGVSNPFWYSVTGTPSTSFFVNVTSASLVAGGATVDNGTYWNPPGWTDISAATFFPLAFVGRQGNGSGSRTLTVNVSIYGSIGGVGSAASGTVTLQALRSL